MMPQEYAIEFLFDEISEKRILELYAQLEQAGFGLPEEILDYQPHITLNVCTILDLEALQPALSDFAINCPSFSLELSHLGVFLAPSPVVFLAPTIRDQLFSVHKHFIHSTKGLIAATRSYYQPNHWVPHCTVAFDFELAKLPDIMKLCSSFSLPLTVSLKHLAVVEVPKGLQLFHASLPAPLAKSNDLL